MGCLFDVRARSPLTSVSFYSFRHDREGKPITYALAKAHKASDQTAQEMLEYIVYQMETSKTLFALDSGIETSSVGGSRTNKNCSFS